MISSLVSLRATRSAWSFVLIPILLLAGCGGGSPSGGEGGTGDSGTNQGGFDGGEIGGGGDPDGGGSDAGTSDGGTSDGGTDAGTSLAPANVGAFLATPGDGQVSLSWTNPSTQFSAVTIRYATGSAPANPTAGTSAYEGSATSTVVTGLTNGTTYHFAAFAHDGAGHYANGVTTSASPYDPALSGSFHAYIQASALEVVTGSSLTFTGVAIGGSGNYTYAWTFYGTPSSATGVGPHVVTFSAASGAPRDVTLEVTDTTTQEVWRQTIYVLVSSSAVGGRTVTLSTPATSSVTVGQGSTVEIYASSSGATWASNFGTASVSGSNLGNLSYDYVSLAFPGTHTATMLAASNPLNDTGKTTLSITVTPEASVGTLSTGLRIGPLMGVGGCIVCNAYVDWRIALRMAESGDGKFIALFDQKMKAVDSDDSMIAAVHNGTQWQPYVDVDASFGKGVSKVGLGEGNPVYMHQFDTAMASNGDAVTVFMQQANVVNPTGNVFANHVWANVLLGGAWTGPRRLGTEPDNLSNATRGPKVVMWRDGSVTRALAVWKRHPNSLGSERLDYAVYASDTDAWTTSAAVTGDVSNGFDEFVLSVNSAGKAFLVYQEYFSKAVKVGTWTSGGGWTLESTAVITPANNKVRLALATSADGTAMLMVGHREGTAATPVWAIRFNGTAWDSAVQIGQNIDVDAALPDVYGTGYTYRSVGELQVRMDATGNAMALWAVEPTTSPSATGGGVSMGASAVYTSGGSWGSFTFFTATASASDFEFLRAPSSSGKAQEFGFALRGTRAVVTYAASKNSLPAGTYKDNLYSRFYDRGTNTWSSQSVVDGHTGETHGHSRVFLRSDDSAMVVYEAWPVNSYAAGIVRARAINP